MDFKKSLAFTTALSAVALLAANAAVAAEKPKLKVYGYQETFMGLGDVDDGTNSSGTPTYTAGDPEGAFAILQYGEIRFLATGMTDSGMKWGVYFEKGMDDAHANKGLSADEANLFLQGSWGKLEIGGQDGAADKMRVSATKLDLLGSNVLGAFVRNRSNSGLRGSDNDNVLDTSDDSKFTYYTPRVSGFQGGISYIPQLGTKGTVPNGTKSGGVEAGVGYKAKVGSAKLNLAGAYSQTGKDGVGGTVEGWIIGGTVGFGAITVGAGYSQNDNWRTPDTTQKAWSVGANYNGGKWEVSLIHVDSKLEFGTNSGFAGSSDDEYQQTQLQGAYNLGGGLTAAAGVYWFEMDSANGANGSATRGPNDGTAVLGKLNAKF